MVIAAKDNQLILGLGANRDNHPPVELSDEMMSKICNITFEEADEYLYKIQFTAIMDCLSALRGLFVSSGIDYYEFDPSCLGLPLVIFFKIVKISLYIKYVHLNSINFIYE